MQHLDVLPLAMLMTSLALGTGCSADTPPQHGQPIESPTAREGTPVFIIAGQSNAEGHVHLTGLLAVRDALATGEPGTMRQAYRSSLGTLCDPAFDASNSAADAALSALAEAELDLSGLARDASLDAVTLASFRWRTRGPRDDLGEPYQDESPSAHPGHCTAIAPLSAGFGLWDEDLPNLFYGPELGLALHMTQKTSLPSFSMLKVTMSGSSLDEHWSPSSPMTHELHQRTRAHLDALGPDAYVAGFVWFQGFNDQFERGPRRRYASNLERLVGNYRAEFGQNLPVVIVQARKVDDLAVIAEAQAEVSRTLDHVVLVESDGLSDCFHYDSASQVVVGQRSASALATLLGITDGP